MVWFVRFAEISFHGNLWADRWMPANNERMRPTRQCHREMIVNLFFYVLKIKTDAAKEQTIKCAKWCNKKKVKIENNP